MRKLLCALTAVLLLSGCSVQPVLVITLSEVIALAVIYIALAAIMASYLSADSKKEAVFWFWVIFNIVAFPIGLVAVIIKICRS